MSNESTAGQKGNGTAIQQLPLTGMTAFTTANLDVCTQCHGLISANAQWCEDRPYCSLCALGLAAEGRPVHGSRIQNMFLTAADKARPGLPANQWLWEEFPVVISGRSFRADFVVRPAFPAIMIAVELDGHPTHSSREARTRDCQRDRLFLKNGWTVVRFTGSEVWHDAAACVEELIEIISREITRIAPQLRAA
jgi:hypothetical protein